MTRKSLPALFFGLIAWIGLGAFANNYFCCGAAAASAATAVAATSAAGATAVAGAKTAALLSVTEGNRLISAASNHSFVFGKSQAAFAKPLHNEVTSAMTKMMTYLNRQGNGAKELLITGSYGQREANNTGLENLGLARANQVRDYLVTQGLPVDRIRTSGTQSSNLKWTRADQVANALSLKIQ